MKNLLPLSLLLFLCLPGGAAEQSIADYLPDPGFEKAHAANAQLNAKGTKELNGWSAFPAGGNPWTSVSYVDRGGKTLGDRRPAIEPAEGKSYLRMFTFKSCSWLSLKSPEFPVRKGEIYSVTFQIAADSTTPMARMRLFLERGGKSYALQEYDLITLEDGTQATFYVAYDAEPEVYFSKMGEDSVRLRMTIGTTEYPTTQIKSDVFQVQDTATRSLLMAREGGKILRQRIFENGVDALETTAIDAGAHPYNLVSVGEELYVFDAGSHVDGLADWEADTSGDGSIRVVDLNTDGVETVITNRGTSAYFGFYNGYADAESVYWTDRNDYVYRVPHGSRNLTFEWLGADDQATYPYYVADASAVEGMPAGISGGIYAYNGTYYWAKGGEGRGLYRFKSQDGTVTTLNNAAILTDYAIRAFVYDRNNNIIYFAGTSANGESGLWKSDLDGLNTQLVDAADLTAGAITGITLDHTAGRVLWAYHNPDDPTASGVKQMNLLRSAVEAPGEVTYFNKEQGILGIALDNVPKLGL